MMRFFVPLVAAALSLMLSACDEFIASARLKIMGIEIPVAKFAQHQGLYFEELEYKATDDAPLPPILKVTLVDGRLAITHLRWLCSDHRSRCTPSRDGNTIGRIYGNIQTQAAPFDALFGSSVFPVEWFVGEWDAPNEYHYFVFRWTGQLLEYVVPNPAKYWKDRHKVSSVEELARKANYRIKHGGTRKFKVLDSAIATARVRQLDSGTMSLAEIQAGKNTAAPNQTTLSGASPSGQLAHLEIGSLVYVRGVVADEAVYVVRTDAATNRVQVMREKDGTDYWIDAGSIISRHQAGVNNVVRGAAILTGIVCMAYPDKCKR